MAARRDADVVSVAPKKAPVPAERLSTDTSLSEKAFDDVRHVGWKLVLTAEQIGLFQQLAKETKHTGEPFRGVIVEQPFAVVIRRTNFVVQAKSKDQIKKEQSRQMYQWFNKWSKHPESVHIKDMYVQGNILAFGVTIGASKYIIVMSHDDDRVHSVEKAAIDGTYGDKIDISGHKITLKPIAYHAAV
jgi:hypothetical protein